MRRMRKDRGAMGPPADLPGMRRHALLRQLTEPPCKQARAPERASRDCVGAAGRALALLLS